MTFDISAYELEETATLTVQNAKGDDDLIGADGKSPVTITLYGGGSRQMVKAQHKAGLQQQARLQQTLRGKIDKNAPEQAERELVEKLVACTKEVSNFPVAPEDIYSNPKLGYITKQVVAFLSDDANFAPPSAMTSGSTSDTQLG